MDDKMTDKEAYELLVKYSGEKGIVMIKEMIHVGGIEKAIENMEWSYVNHGHKTNQEFRDWMRQSFNYLIEIGKASN